MKTMTASTHIGQVREEQADLITGLTNCLQWSRERWCEYQFEQYCRFVDILTEGWYGVRENILYSPVFRGFWNNEWAKRDREFLDFATHYLTDPVCADDLVFVIGEYQYLHDALRLLEDDEFMIKYNHILHLL